MKTPTVWWRLPLTKNGVNVTGTYLDLPRRYLKEFWQSRGRWTNYAKMVPPVVCNEQKVFARKNSHRKCQLLSLQMPKCLELLAVVLLVTALAIDGVDGKLSGFPYAD